MTSFKEKIRPALNGIDQKIKIYEENKAVKDKNDSFPNNLSTTTGYKVFRDNIEFPETNAEKNKKVKSLTISLSASFVLCSISFAIAITFYNL